MRGRIVVHAANESHPVHLPGQPGQMLTDVVTRNRGGDGIESALDAAPRLGLEVKSVDVAQPAPREHHDATAGLTKTARQVSARQGPI